MKLPLRPLNTKGYSHLLMPIAAIAVVGGIGTYMLTASHADAAVPHLTCSAIFSPSANSIVPNRRLTITATIRFGNNGGGTTLAHYHSAGPIKLTSTIGAGNASTNRGLVFLEFISPGYDMNYQPTTSTHGYADYRGGATNAVKVTLPTNARPGSTSYIPALHNGQIYKVPLKFQLNSGVHGSGDYGFRLQATRVDSRGNTANCGGTKTYHFN